MFSNTSKMERARGKTHTQSLPFPQQGPRVSTAAPSLLSGDILLLGNVSSGGDVHVDGIIDGNLGAVQITIGEKATVRGDIFAEDVVVRGHVTGTITAIRVQLCSSCHVEGNVLYRGLNMEVGARLNGSCRHAADPLATLATVPSP
jgi:cytoskeletal protein CcmA (bactofilin family)